MTGLHTLIRNKSNKTKTRIGRGGKRGKTSGRGHKGQRQHGGHGVRPELRDMIKKLPKLRGHGKNRARTVHDSRIEYLPVNIKALVEVFKDGDSVSPKELVALGVVTTRAGKLPHIKILGTGEITIKLKVEGCKTSVSAKAAIEKAGGSIA